jgi:hypothetical protein
LHPFFWRQRAAIGESRNQRVFWRPRSRRSVSPSQAPRAWLALAACGLVFAGCQPELQIHSYQIPKEVASSKPPVSAMDGAAVAEPPANSPPGRMLAAIVLWPGQAWFFKMSGPLAAVTAHAEEFEKFIPSLRFEPDAPPEWQTPAGWSQDPAGGTRFATLKSPPESPAVEITVTMLPFGAVEGADNDYLLFNINRWRGQLQAPPISAPQLANETKRVEVHGATAIVVDIVGKLAPTGMGPPGMGAAPHPPFAGGLPKSEAASQPGRMLAAIVLRPGEGWFFKLSGPRPAVTQHAEEFQKLVASVRFDETGTPQWQAPEDWARGPSNPMRFATLVVPGAPTPLDLTISKLPYSGPDPLEYALRNVNRWRDQLQLPHTTREQLSADLQRVSLAEGEALVVDLSGQQGQGAAGMNVSPIAPGVEHGN